VIGGAEKEDVQKIRERYDEKYSRDLMADFEDELGGNVKKAVLKVSSQATLCCVACEV
jgi:hypothetical protein